MFRLVMLMPVIMNVSFPCNGVQNLSTLEQGEEAELRGELGKGVGNTTSAGESKSLKSCLGRHMIAS